MAKNYYAELSVSDLILDIDNPRIAELLSRGGISKENISPEAIALALGASEESYENLKNSIKENDGIINPIIVLKKEEQYLVVEGNTRVQIYKKFLSDGIPGSWETIPAIVYTNISEDEIHAIRLQAHLIGTREWTPFAQAKYVHTLYYQNKMSLSKIVDFCGGKKARIEQLIKAYDDVENYYRPMCADDTQPDIRNFSSFIELQRPAIQHFMDASGITKKDFVQWVIDNKFDRQEHVRRLPEIWKSKEARQAFLNEGSDTAIKILNVEEYSDKELNGVSYEKLAIALANKLIDIKASEIRDMRQGRLTQKYDALLQVQDALAVVLEEVGE